MSLPDDIVSSISSFKYRNLQVIIKNGSVLKQRTKELPLAGSRCKIQKGEMVIYIKKLNM